MSPPATVTVAGPAGPVSVPVLAQADDELHPVTAAKAAATVLPRASSAELPAGSVPWGDRSRLRGLVAGFLA